MNRVIDYLIAHPPKDDGEKYALITAILRAMLIVPQLDDVSGHPEKLSPLVATIDGVPHVVVFNSIESAKEAREAAPYGLTMTGADIITRLVPGTALLVAADSGRIGFTPEMLDTIRADIAAGRA